MNENICCRRAVCVFSLYLVIAWIKVWKTFAYGSLNQIRIVPFVKEE